MIYRSPHPEVRIPDVPLAEFVLRRAAALGQKPALVDGTDGRRITYAQLPELVASTSAALRLRGFEKGDVLAVYSPNTPEYAVAFLGAASAGGVTTTINPLYTAEEVASQLRDARAKYLITSPQLLERAREAARDTTVEEIFVFGEAQDGATAFASLVESGAGAELPPVEIDPREDLVALPYSSGTTGTAKGVMLTHHNLVANLTQFGAAGFDWSDDTLVCVLPMFHIYGLVVILNYGLASGSTVVTLPRFDLEQVLGVIQNYRVTVAHLVPPVVLALAKHPVVERFDLSSLKTVFSGAAPLGEQLSQECSARLGCDVIQGYGMTETSPVTHLAPHDGSGRHGSVGVCVSNMECKIVSVETGATLGAGEEGEICVRGPQVMKGYLNRPDATAATIDAEGWLHTGDIGRADADGFFFIVDRAKELIKYKGFQVAPAELEALLLTHPSVADAAVVPSPDAEAGEVPKAFVVARGGESARPEPEELMEFVAARVAPHKKIRRVEFVEQIPKSPSGKILRRVLIAREREQAAGKN
ncbi:MAG TPA: 4-coumarate--CoA ligase family protein [Pyrinomonadaceae bacterium]|nr:4-coumarate--CoA ligase family protein [Pyrinomonadaceae bacterium]